MKRQLSQIQQQKQQHPYQYILNSSRILSQQQSLQPYLLNSSATAQIYCLNCIQDETQHWIIDDITIVSYQMFKDKLNVEYDLETHLLYTISYEYDGKSMAIDNESDWLEMRKIKKVKHFMISVCIHDLDWQFEWEDQIIEQKWQEQVIDQDDQDDKQKNKKFHQKFNAKREIDFSKITQDQICYKPISIQNKQQLNSLLLLEQKKKLRNEKLKNRIFEYNNENDDDDQDLIKEEIIKEKNFDDFDDEQLCFQMQLEEISRNEPVQLKKFNKLYIEETYEVESILKKKFEQKPKVILNSASTTKSIVKTSRIYAKVLKYQQNFNALNDFVQFRSYGIVNLKKNGIILKDPITGLFHNCAKFLDRLNERRIDKGVWLVRRILRPSFSKEGFIAFQTYLLSPFNLNFMHQAVVIDGEMWHLHAMEQKAFGTTYEIVKADPEKDGQNFEDQSLFERWYQGKSLVSRSEILSIVKEINQKMHEYNIVGHNCADVSSNLMYYARGQFSRKETLDNISSSNFLKKLPFRRAAAWARNAFKE